MGIDLLETETRGMRFVDARVATLQRDVFELDEFFFSSSGGEMMTTTGLRPPRSFTTVLSDMAPSTAGNAVLDAARSYQLAEAAVRLALGEAALDVLDEEDDDDEKGGDDVEDENFLKQSLPSSPPSSGGGGKGLRRGSSGLLRKGGNLVIKLLEGPGGGRQDLQKVCKPLFEKFQWYRPKATRRESTEVFLIARGRR